MRRTNDNIPVPGRHFAFVEVVQRISYHTVLLHGSELGVESRAREMLDRGDSALACRTVVRQAVEVKVKPVQAKHLRGRGPVVIVHEDPRDPFRWTWTTNDGRPAGTCWADAGLAIKNARDVHGYDADVTIQAEGYPGDTPVADKPPADPVALLRDRLRVLSDQSSYDGINPYDRVLDEMAELGLGEAG
jgi:hypothetical protein